MVNWGAGSADVEIGSTAFGPYSMRWAEIGATPAPFVLLLHGLYAGAHSYEWRRTAELLASDHRVRFPDLLGCGQSDRPEIDYSPEVLEAAVATLIADTPPNAVVVASSLTAAYATRALASRPTARRLVLITPTGLGERREVPRAERGRRLYDLVRKTPLGRLLVAGLTSGPSVKWFQQQKTYRRPQSLTSAEVAEVRRAGRLAGAQHLQLGFVFDRLSIDLDTDDVARTRPTVLWADGQSFTDSAEATDWEQAGAVVRRSRSGLPQVESPAEVVDLVRGIDLPRDRRPASVQHESGPVDRPRGQPWPSVGDMPLLEAIADIEADGASTEHHSQFRAEHGGQVRCLTCQQTFPGSSVSGEGTRLEGASDPADMLMVVLALCPSCGASGALILVYGPYAAAEDSEVLLALGTNVS